jgi:succinate dehydrogenase / fumarate reductase iron-sulfur subunit
MSSQQFVLKVLRGTPSNQYWEEFEQSLYPSANLISVLMDIQKNPINRQGAKTTPIAWEQGCLEEVCGSCSLLVNGRPRQACTALIANLIQENGPTITLAPFTKFPLIRDLVVDRTSMFEALKRVRAWISVDGTWDNRENSPPIAPEVQEALYTLSTCMTCGCCSESCPQVHAKSPYMGPAAMSQVRLFNSHPTGALQKSERLRATLSEEGIAGCGNAQNCARVCPKNIPLTESLALIGREASKQAIRDALGLPDAES